MKILGVHIGHYSGASLVIDGKIIADVAEERFVRIKHYTGLPFHSIDYCLNAGKISIEDNDYLAIPALQLSNFLDFLFDKLSFSNDYSIKIKKIIKTSLEIINAIHSIKPPLYLKKISLNRKTKISNTEHHLAHTASAHKYEKKVMD